MAVVVQQVGSAADGAPKETTVPDGEHFFVDDGALVVLEAEGGLRLALFAAGTWLSAQVQD